MTMWSISQALKFYAAGVTLRDLDDWQEEKSKFPTSFQ